MSTIHETALVDPAAELASDVEVGPYSIIGPKPGTKFFTLKDTIRCSNYCW